jgi:hypothetical protein
MKRPDEKNYSYNAEIYESYAYCRDMVKYANTLEAQIKTLEQVTLGLTSVSGFSDEQFKPFKEAKGMCKKCLRHWCICNKKED